MMAVWKWAPAVAAGNTVILKPSELTPSSTSRMAELLAEVLPSGVVNVVCGGILDRDGFFLEPAVLAGLRQDDGLVPRACGRIHTPAQCDSCVTWISARYR